MHIFAYILCTLYFQIRPSCFQSKCSSYSLKKQKSEELKELKLELVWSNRPDFYCPVIIFLYLISKFLSRVPLTYSICFWIAIEILKPTCLVPFLLLIEFILNSHTAFLCLFPIGWYGRFSEIMLQFLKSEMSSPKAFWKCQRGDLNQIITG